MSLVQKNAPKFKVKKIKSLLVKKLEKILKNNVLQIFMSKW